MVEILTIETPSLGDRSYIVTDGTDAAVIDPQRDVDRVLALVDEHGLSVTHVFETHIHNDYVTGGLVLAGDTGAAYLVAADEEVDYDREPVSEGQVVKVGALRVRVVHTPGHTPTHLSYVVLEDGRPVAVFTGGSMLYGTVGRTDLIARSRAEELSRAQFRSARRLADELPDDATVHPTHGFGSFCSSIDPDLDDASSQGSTIGEERQTNLALTVADEDEFVRRLLGGLDAYPRYYAHMGPRNRLGPERIDLSPPAVADPEELLYRIRAGEWVVDLRDRVAFAGDHLRGTVNLGLEDFFSTYLGWLVPWSIPVTLIADSADHVADAQRQLVRIGIDRPAAAATGGIGAIAGDVPRARYPVASFDDLDADEALVLDVRRNDEWDENRIRGAQHIPLHELSRRMDEVPDDREVWVHCKSGYRASIAASLLDRAGRRPTLIDDDFEAAVEAGLTEGSS